MKFDLEAAKRGEAVQVKRAGDKPPQVSHGRHVM